MHVRLSACIGALVLERGSDETLGSLAGIVIHPDTGVIEGITVSVPHFLGSQTFFCPASDILHWGASLQVRSADSLADPYDIIRMRSLLEQRRPLLGQRMRTEGGRHLGRCVDVQCDTSAMRIEWLFPRRFFRWGIALPLSDVTEVRIDAIIVRDPALPTKQRTERPEVTPVLAGFPDVAEARSCTCTAHSAKRL